VKDVDPAQWFSEDIKQRDNEIVFQTGSCNYFQGMVMEPTSTRRFT